MAMRPEVPAPTYTSPPPRLRTGTASSTAAFIAGRAGLTAAQAASCPSYMASIMSLVDHESRSTNLGLMCSVSISAHLSLPPRLCRCMSFDGPKAGPRLPHHLQAGKENARRQAKATQPDAMPGRQAARYAALRIPPVNESAHRHGGHLRRRSLLRTGHQPLHSLKQVEPSLHTVSRWPVLPMRPT